MKDGSISRGWKVERRTRKNPRNKASRQIREMVWFGNLNVQKGKASNYKTSKQKGHILGLEIFKAQKRKAPLNKISRQKNGDVWFGNLYAGKGRKALVNKR
jgi:hypothetical protein